MQGDDDNNDKDDRTLFVGGLHEKMNQDLLYELFFQAGPIERVAIPKEKDGKIKSYGFVTYKHLVSVDYALNIFAGTRLFGRELLIKNRNSNKNREFSQYKQSPSSVLIYGHNSMSPQTSLTPEMSPQIVQQHQQQLLHQQLIMMASGKNYSESFLNTAQLFAGSQGAQYTSTRPDISGSQREHYPDRNRYRREESRSNRAKPYRRSKSRSRSRSPPSHRSRDRSSPTDYHRNNHQDKSRRNDSRSNYHRWNHHHR